nr:uncharacterized protein LOC108943134 [Nicotiana tomentosiformis]
MDKFVTRLPSFSSSSHPSIAPSIAPEIQRDPFVSDLDLESLEPDPGDRKSIAEYSPNIRDEVRRHYIKSGPCRPMKYDFPKTTSGSSFDRQSEKEKSESRRRLSASINVARFLLRLELLFRGHDESHSSTNRGIFLELLQWYGDIDRDVGSIILENAPKNEMMCSPIIQKDIVDACSKETIKAIIEDLDGDFFGILVDESEDISHKEQMALVLRYVNKKGELTLMALAKKHSDVDDFFCIVTNVLNIVGESFKRRDLLRQHQADKLEELLILGEIHTGRGLNQ